MSYSFTTRQNDDIPFLYQSRKVTRAEMGGALGEIFPTIHAYCTQNGVAFAGPPLVRYTEMEGSDGFAIEAGIPIQPGSGGAASKGAGKILAGTIPGGRVAVTVHKGPYENLRDAFEALEAWLRENGIEPAGPPWESYLNDPGEVEPADYLTEIVAPIR